MFSEIRTMSAELQCRHAFRIAFALMPFRGSDREVGWAALEADKAAGRHVTYITAPVDFHAIAQHFPHNLVADETRVLNFGTVKVISWPFDLPNRLMPIGYIRFVIWIILLQIFINIRMFKGEEKKVHFLTYTQLATPIILSRKVKVFHGPVGVIPRVPATAPVSRKLRRKSWIMWHLIMPIIKSLNCSRADRTAVVHPSLVQEIGDKSATEVLSALNIDYLGSAKAVEDERTVTYDAIVVARDVVFKNLDIVKAAFAEASDRHGVRCLVVNAGRPEDFRRVDSGVTEIGRQDRRVVANYLRCSRLHVMLSVELGGYINLEAASFGLPTLCLDGFGASAMLNPSHPFLLHLDELHPTTVASRISELLEDETQLRREALTQAGHADTFIRSNRDKFDHWLDATG
jgi:glycosyltransferase involved in cell wall biosynthesis